MAVEGGNRWAVRGHRRGRAAKVGGACGWPVSSWVQPCGGCRSCSSAGTFNGLSDGELLERFLERRDEVAELAFAVLVERHGPMVLGVCRRIMQDSHDAEDAFQATFLVLARKGRSVRVQGSLGRWLFGVATRVATRARGDRRRRQVRERSGLDRVEAAQLDASLAAVGPGRDRRGGRRGRSPGLPGRFQAAVLLCDLEGTSCEEAARRLGWPVGTVKSRLSRARARLRDRLTRRGLTPADLALVTIKLPASPAPGLVEATTRAALALGSGQLQTTAGVSATVACLTQGVLRTMFITRLKLAAAALVLVAIGSAVLFGQASAQKAEPARAGTAPKGDDQIDLEMLERAWADALARRDTAVVSRILADDFEGIDPAGAAFSKPAYLADLAHGRFAADNRLLDTRVRLFGETGVVISLIQSKPSGSSERSTKVYARRRGRWQCVAMHAGGVQGAVFGKNAKAEWRKAIDEWKKFPAVDKTNCVSCHTAGVHAEYLRVGRTHGEQLNCTTCHMANVHQNDLLQSPGGWTAAKPAIAYDKLTNVRPPFECRVVKIQVNLGEAVKKGSPLLELFSAEMAAAKSRYVAAVIQWRRDNAVAAHKKAQVAFESKRVPDQSLKDAENNEHRSLGQMESAKAQLLMYGMTDEDITNLGKEPDRQARWTVRAPVDGTILAVGAVLWKSYDRKDVLVQIRSNPGQLDRKP